MPALPGMLATIGRALVVYAFVLFGMRVTGKREIGEFTPFDLVLLLIISESVQNAIVGSDVTLAGGIVAAATLFLANYVVTYLTDRLPVAHRLIEGTPTVLIEDGRVVEETLRRERITAEELAAALRRNGVESPEKVRRAVLEVDGTVSVIRYEAECPLDTPYTGRRRKT